MANAGVFLASPRASFITGTNLIIDGGLGGEAIDGRLKIGDRRSAQCASGSGRSWKLTTSGLA